MPRSASSSTHPPHHINYGKSLRYRVNISLVLLPFVRGYNHYPFTRQLVTAMASGPVTVVTGANKGIGYEIIKKAAPAAGVAVLAARNEALGQEAVKKLHDEGLSNIVYRQLDVASPSSIQAFAEGIKADFGRCDILVNNAGVAFKQSDPTSFRDQAEPTLKVNFWGTVDLIEKMTPLLRAAESPRIVNVASQSGRLSILDTDKAKQKELSSPTLTKDRLFALIKEFEKDVKEGRHAEKGWPNTCYGMSKLGLISYTKVFAREEKEKKKKIWIAACCPGWCATDMSSHGGPRSAEVGARTPAALALGTLGDGEKGVGGFYYDEHKIAW